MVRLPGMDYTPTMAEVMRTVIERRLSEMHVCLPAKVVTYDKATQLASVEIQLQKLYEDGTLLSWPIISNVPVKHPRAQGTETFIHMPLQPGDDLVLVFSERSLDNWKTQGGMTDPNDRRKFSITDAFALIGGSAIPDAFTPETDDSIEIVNGDSKAIVHPDGKYELKGGNDDDFIKAVRDLVILIQQAYAATLIGYQPIITPSDPTWSLILARMQAFTE